MGMIINDKLDTLMKGYPTLSDKYCVRGATLSSDSANAHFGDFVTYDGGTFKVVDSSNTITSADKVAGVVVATNVKLVTDFMSGKSAEALTYPGEAFNLLLHGYVALPCDTTISVDTITEGLTCKVTSAGLLTTASSGTELPNYKFTGITHVEYTDSTKSTIKTLLAEVAVCC